MGKVEEKKDAFPVIRSYRKTTKLTRKLLLWQSSERFSSVKGKKLNNRKNVWCLQNVTDNTITPHANNTDWFYLIHTVGQLCFQWKMTVPECSRGTHQQSSSWRAPDSSLRLLSATLHCRRLPQHVSQVSENLNSSITLHFILGATVKTLRGRALSGVKSPL